MFRKVLRIVYKDSNMVDKGFSGACLLYTSAADKPKTRRSRAKKAAAPAAEGAEAPVAEAEAPAKKATKKPAAKKAEEADVYKRQVLWWNFVGDLGRRSPRHPPADRELPAAASLRRTDEDRSYQRTYGIIRVLKNDILKDSGRDRVAAREQPFG